MQTLREPSHLTTDVDGDPIHSVRAGTGPALVFVAGWPEWWWTWRHVMAALQDRYTVHAVDLRGQGASHMPATGYDGVSVAAELHRWVEIMQIDNYVLIGHDIGTWVSFAYACSYPEGMKGLVLSDALIPGLPVIDSPTGRASDSMNIAQWQFSFNRLPELPEFLIRGHERELITWLFKYKSKHPERILPEVIDAFSEALKDPGFLRAGFEFYRAIPQNDMQNAELAKRGLRMPVLTIGAGAGVGRNLYKQIQPFASNLEDATIDDGGHYLSEEVPEEMGTALAPFLERCFSVDEEHHRAL